MLNPPYKNTDENDINRVDANANYAIHQSILDLTGNDAGNERYLAFLGQIMNIARVQMGDLTVNELTFEDVQLPKPLDPKKVETPLLMIFTPSSWLIPRPTYVPFRKTFDKYFKYEKGFIITGNEFFKIKGRFPIAFTIWNYNYNEKGNKNKILVKDFTHLSNNDFKNINWNSNLEKINEKVKGIIKNTNIVKLDNSRGDIKDGIPIFIDAKGLKVKQNRVNIYRNKTKEEDNQEFISGFPKKDIRHSTLKVPYGFANGEYVAFMDDGTPVRIKPDTQSRVTNKPNRVWFYLDNRMISINILKILALIQ